MEDFSEEVTFNLRSEGNCLNLCGAEVVSKICPLRSASSPVILRNKHEIEFLSHAEK